MCLGICKHGYSPRQSLLCPRQQSEGDAKGTLGELFPATPCAGEGLLFCPAPCPLPEPHSSTMHFSALNLGRGLGWQRAAEVGREEGQPEMGKAPSAFPLCTHAGGVVRCSGRKVFEAVMRGQGKRTPRNILQCPPNIFIRYKLLSIFKSYGTT